MSRFCWAYHNHPSRANRLSLHDAIRLRHAVPNVGCMGDPTDRGQPNRFKKWYKIPKTAHRLYWRVRSIKWWK